MTKVSLPLLSLASLLVLAHTTFASINVEFDLEPGIEHVREDGFCFEIKVPGNSLVSGAFTSESINEPVPGQMPPRILANIFDEKRNTPFSRPDLQGEARFSFRSPDVPTEHRFCFRLAARKGAPASVPAGSVYPVKLEVNYDYDLFDEKLAHDFKVKPVETEFIKLEEKMRSVANELAGMVQNEAAMRSVNESTFTRVWRFSLLSIMALIGLSVYEFFYLKRFFRTKKLI